MKSSLILSIFAVTILAAQASAQHGSYSGQEKREIKALSADEVKQLLAGSGMGFARAAELNNYPGPMHALELAGKLALTPEQRAATEKLMAKHKAEARAIGAKLIEAERVLDQMFASDKVSQSLLAQQVRTVAALHGEYRLSHLETHRRLRPLFTEEQIIHYAKLRGYADSNSPSGPHKH